MRRAISAVPCQNRLVSQPDLTADAAAARPLAQVAALTRWVGTGRKLTQAGRVTMADARELVALLETGDRVDPVIGDEVFRTRTSERLPARDRRGVGQGGRADSGGNGRLVPVKKNASLLDRPLHLWPAMFEAYGQLGETVYASRWLPSLIEQHLAVCVAAVLSGMAERGGAIGIDDAGDLVWNTLATHYRLDHATAEWRKDTARDVRIALALLVRLGALTDDAGTFRLTPLAEWAQRRRYGITGRASGSPRSRSPCDTSNPRCGGACSCRRRSGWTVCTA